MKLTTLILLSVMCLSLSCGCSLNPPNNISSEPTEANNTSESNSTNESAADEVIEIDTPYSGVVGNAIWDMKIWKDYLYIGAGDFDKNATVSIAYKYDMQNNKWESCGNIPDEQINRFVVLHNQLIIPGIDPARDWNIGNYYVLQGNTFTTMRTLPNAIHNFDIAEYDGVLFFALGVSSGNSPLLKYVDGDFEAIELIGQNGKTLLTDSYREVRIYDLFVLDESLYAYVQLDSNKSIYRYNGTALVYYSNYDNKIVVGGFSYVPILEKKVYKGELYFTTGLLYSTKDMKDLKDITPNNVHYVSDMIVLDDQLYILANRTSENEKNCAVILKMQEDGSFAEIKVLTTDVPAMSFESDGEFFYLGLGKKEANAVINSRILRVKKD